MLNIFILNTHAQMLKLDKAPPEPQKKLSVFSSPLQ